MGRGRGQERGQPWRKLSSKETYHGLALGGIEKSEGKLNVSTMFSPLLCYTHHAALVCSLMMRNGMLLDDTNEQDTQTYQTSCCSMLGR